MWIKLTSTLIYPRHLLQQQQIDTSWKYTEQLKWERVEITILSESHKKVEIFIEHNFWSCLFGMWHGLHSTGNSITTQVIWLNVCNVFNKTLSTLGRSTFYITCTSSHQLFRIWTFLTVINHTCDELDVSIYTFMC